MALVRAKVKPELLKWGRTSAGLSLPEAAAKAAVAPEKMAAWEAGEDRPTINQLHKLAKAYRRPISVFYLSHVPRDFEPMHDFRRLPGEIALVYSSALRLEIRAAYQRRQLALSLLEEIEQEPPKFAWQASIEEDPEIVAARVRDILHLTYGEQVQWREERKSYNAWRRKIEAAGALVFQAVGITTAQMRGFSIAERILPVITVNAKDQPNGRTFTLLHEFVHLMLHESGLCDLDEEGLRSEQEQRIEVYCNHVAGAALVPRDLLLREPIVSSKRQDHSEWDDDELLALSHQYGVSREVVLRRLLILGRTTVGFYAAKRREFLAQYRRAAPARAPGEFRRNLPRETVSNYGRTFTQIVLMTYQQDRIALSDAAQYLGVRARQLPAVEEMTRA